MATRRCGGVCVAARGPNDIRTPHWEHFHAKLDCVPPQCGQVRCAICWSCVAPPATATAGMEVGAGGNPLADGTEVDGVLGRAAPQFGHCWSRIDPMPPHCAHVQNADPGCVIVAPLGPRPTNIPLVHWGFSLFVFTSVPRVISMTLSVNELLQGFTRHFATCRHSFRAGASTVPSVGSPTTLPGEAPCCSYSPC